MTNRERILTAFGHNPPDRTPTDGWFHPEVREALMARFRTRDWKVVLEALHVTPWPQVQPRVRFSTHEARVRPRPGREGNDHRAWIDERTYEDPWGTRFRLDERSRYEEWLSGPLENAGAAADIAKFPFPTPSDLEDPAEFAAAVDALKKQGQFVCGGAENPFKRLWHLRGYENALMDYAADPEMVHAVYEPLFALIGESCRRMARAGIDMIKVVGDIAMQDRIIMGPDLWRRIDKPYWQRLIGDCRRINGNTTFFFHSDGKLDDLMEDLVDTGFTVINPIQPECMDPFEIKKRWGGRIVLHGCVSIQKTLPFGTVEDVRGEITELVRRCGSDGGLVIMPSNVIQPDTPLDNIIACYETAAELDPRSV